MKFFLMICVVLVGLGFCGQVMGLGPEEIALVVNSASSDSREIAQYYCLKRGVPESHIIGFEMPISEDVPRQMYEEQIAPRIRSRLSESDMKGKIKCLVTVYRVPLKIGPVVPTGLPGQKRELLIRLLDERFGQLQQFTTDLEELVQPDKNSTTPKSEPKKFELDREPVNRSKNSASMFKKAEQAFQAAQAQMSKESEQQSLAGQSRVHKFGELAEQWFGLQGRIAGLTEQIKRTGNIPLKASLQGQLDQAQAELGQKAEQIKTTPEDITGWERYYELIYEVGGLKTLCDPRVLPAQRSGIGDDNTTSSFDSELSLVLWEEPYPLGMHLPNMLRVHTNDSLEKTGPTNGSEQKYPTIMVSRLDGVDKDIAKGLIDKAIAAEKVILRGHAYLDARGMHKEAAQFGSYEFFDEKVRKLAEVLKEETTLEIVLDDKPELFGVGACPDTILYCGWYKLLGYVDSFKFNIGAVGYHIASWEAWTLRGIDPKSNYDNAWCKRMLEKGITATLGAVNEPYLYTFPPPDTFFGDLVSGKYCLVECYYRSNPFNSWQFVLVGDPLYKPQFAKTRGFKPQF
jgi:uncharacterized protein (TIGR03790 family)